MAQDKESTIEEKDYSKFDTFKKEVIADYTIACISREMSLLGRREVLTGKAKFGIFGDGKEIAQLAMAKQFKNGDFRSGYYRDQTFMMAIGALGIKDYYAGLYADTKIENEPTSGGRQMGGHYATRSLNVDGSWKNLMQQKNSSADISPTAGQMPRLLGLALASKMYRNIPELEGFTNFSYKGNEVAFGTIGDASTSEGLFWETMNAAGVLEVPMAISIWDDGWGISVPKKFQTTKASISEALSGFEKAEDSNGFKIYKVKGWDYPSLMRTYNEAISYCRENHVPTLIHVEEVTQPQGHSTSGSHERYKTPEQLKWAEEFDCIAQMKKWMLSSDNAAGEAIASEDELDAIRKDAKKKVRVEQKKAWANFVEGIKEDLDTALILLDAVTKETGNEEIATITDSLKTAIEPIRKDIISTVKKALRLIKEESGSAKQNLIDWINNSNIETHERYGSYLYSESDQSPIKIKEVLPIYEGEASDDGRIVLKENFRKLFEKYPELITFGEDTGKIGGVNQSMEGMQEQFGTLRVSDTGIREATIIGQGIGMAMRGLRPIAEIQYLDYILYCLQIMSDDLATVQWRTKGGQKAPLIIRTRGHRLEGIWHAGSPMAAIINLVKGIHICVPRNMTKAAGFYNTLLEGDDPALVVECLNGYRSKEKMPTNLSEFKTPIGVVETVKEGEDITVVSYGSTFNLCQIAAEELEKQGVSVELIDVQTLMPFDINHDITASLKKTNRIIFIDEDFPGGTTAYMMQQVLHKQGGYHYLDSAPIALAGKEHRPAYGSDGDYFSKPNVEDIFDAIYEMMNEVNPKDYPSIY
ncbi:MAG: thiamine pyrophosphate-dependent enzyme [Flavobacteriales bacterium]|nr:thiamine pyrophosphate-dependent enzyme [Flavobacteriales bacterium]